MKNLNRYIYLLLFCIFLQNDTTGFVDFVRKLIESKDHLSLFLKNTDNSTTEEESEEGEKESKENESNENENKEKEKELKNIKHIHTFIFLPVAKRVGPFRKSEDSKLFSLAFDTETPPPKNILALL